MRDLSNDLSHLSVNTATVRKSRGVDWPLDRIIQACAARGIRCVSPWRDQVAALGLSITARLLKAEGFALSGYCRGGFFTSKDGAGLQAALDDNRRTLDEAATLGAPFVVLVVGSLPGALDGHAQDKDIEVARAQAKDGIARLLDDARDRGMRLAIEPLHPMQAADRACVNTLELALDWCDELDPGRTGVVGVAVDAYHVWWDPKLRQQIGRAGTKPMAAGPAGSAGRLFGWHVCDWRLPTRDLLNDRAMMGDGVIELRKIRGWLENAGYRGPCEAEVFSALDWWQRDAQETLDVCVERYRSVV